MSGGQLRIEGTTRLPELEAQKVALFEELGRIAEIQKALGRELRRVEKAQRAELEQVAEHQVPEEPDLADVEAWAESVYWSHARTMLGNPHQYVAKKRCADPRSYERIIGYILEHGRPQRYGGAIYTVYDFEMHGQRYFAWPMTDRPEESEVLNAKPHSLRPKEEEEDE